MEVSKKKNQLTDLNYYKNELTKMFQNQKNNYFILGGILAKLKASECFKADISSITNKNYKDVFEFVKVNFNLASTSCKNYINVNLNFCDEFSKPKEKYQKYSFTQLVEMLPLNEEQRELVSETMTCLEIRALRKAKKSQLTDKRQDKDKEKVLKPDDIPIAVNFKTTTWNRIKAYLKKRDDRDLDEFIDSAVKQYFKYLGTLSYEDEKEEEKENE